MKKNLLLSFLVLFALSTAVFAGDPKKESEKPAVNNPKENKLSEEEINRLGRHAETDNISFTGISEKNDSKNNLVPPQEVYVVRSHHHGYYLGGAGLILLIILIVVLV
jgi:hypothetical protein